MDCGDGFEGRNCFACFGDEPCRERLAWPMAGLAGALLLASLAWTVGARKGPQRATAIRFQIPSPEKMIFKWTDSPAISPDGEHIVFTASSSTPNAPRLFVRPLNADTPTEIPVAGNAGSFPFWPPDGQQIAFFTEEVQRVDVSGGSPATISKFGGNSGTWNREGVIIATTRSDLLFRMAVAGGEATPLRPLADGETAQKWPQFLPDGKHYLYLSKSNRPGQQGIYAASLDSGYAANDQSGQLLYMRGDALMAQPFDLASLTLRGEPHPVVDHIEGAGNFEDQLSGAIFPPLPMVRWCGAAASANRSRQSSNGSIAAARALASLAKQQITRVRPSRRTKRNWQSPSANHPRDIWIVDLMRGTKTRLTFNPSDDLNPVWSPDGTRIAFISDRKGLRNIYQKFADGSGPEDLLLEGKEGQRNAESWS
jgi:hypothetical protein